jgi:hypothetical protein
MAPSKALRTRDGINLAPKKEMEMMEMENEEIGNKQTTLGALGSTPIGTVERPMLEAKDCKVLGVEMKEGVKNNRAWQKLVLYVKHPDREEKLSMSDAKVEVAASKLEIRALFINLDSENKIEKGSAIAALLQHYGIQNINALVGKTVQTARDAKGYLCVRAY